MPRAPACIGILVALATVLAWSPARAKTSKGYFVGYTGNVADERTALDEGSAIVVEWTVYTLLDEPVVMCNSAWFVNPRSKVRASAKGIPTDVLAKLEIYQVKMVGWYRHTGLQRTVKLECDLGAPGRPIVANYSKREDYLAHYKRLTEAERQRHVGFNVPGSPRWSELFLMHDGYDSGQWLKEADRSRCNCRGTASGRRASISPRYESG